MQIPNQAIQPQLTCNITYNCYETQSTLRSDTGTSSGAVDFTTRDRYKNLLIYFFKWSQILKFDEFYTVQLSTRSYCE